MPISPVCAAKYLVLKMPRAGWRNINFVNDAFRIAIPVP